MWEQPVSLICYAIVAAIVVFLSIKLSDYVDLLDKKTKVSGAFLGGILLAAVTSLPELFTSLTSTILLKNNHYVVGNILGSDLFNLALFFIVFTIFTKKFIDSKVDKHHLVTLSFIAIMYGLVTIAAYVFNFKNILLGWFNPMSIVILVVYAISVWKTPKEDEAEDKETDSPLTVKQIITYFVICSVLLVGASIGVTYLTDWVVTSFKMGSTFGGALFLGVATSLPEMTATITLCKKRNVNAAFGNILGSCVFNFIILTIADVFSWNAGPLYVMDNASKWLLILGAVSIVITLVSCVVFFKNNRKITVKSVVFFRIMGVLLACSYIAFIVLSNI